MPRQDDSVEPNSAKESHVAPAAANKLSDERRQQLEMALNKKSQHGVAQSVGANKQPRGESGAKGGKQFSHQKHGA